MTSLVHDTRPALEAPAAAPAARRSRMTPGRWVVWALLVGGALVMAFPVYWILVTALTPGGQSRSGEFYLWPSEPTLANFAEAFASQPVGRWIVNSIVIAGIGTAITVIVALMAGYAFAKFSFRGRGVLFGAFLVTIVVPAQVTLVPSFLVVVDLHLVDTIWAVILPRAGDAIAVFIARQFMLKIPDALLEAARIDGAGELAIFRRIVLPMSGPLVGVLVILAFMGKWNDFLWPLVTLQGTENLTLPVALSSMQSSGIFDNPWGPIMAIAFLSLLPLLVVFLVFQRTFVQGIASTGLK
ncbi:MAG TPA: carbohydrate ABC transporter permease [Pseudonocardia sp.]|uniref:carbohydrate ABC transporter permease n=1 Tax=Pseudonocardia sp. TaxID=60912 RepID=UPI002B4AF232|nr:carbohydrate ABC transporter permease [Pseudonocardia sp.]HLU54628.1 carbohydrate ABC transporter permease [Pseudonocardia sp.]